ncbi:hypothetical protein [Motilimonas eburnea]|uniref:hypothetical protein n=1 Tax=Motilimonas eburnea TaxID=1737488 RepID=UPI001E413B89|nr:hypothetical protein [Motilimonas eburnea]MCE2571860.1 hypothetical protein [Motilimonas eburnea]
MFECGNLQFSIITPGLIDSYHQHGKSKSYREHFYKLTVNKNVTRLDILQPSSHRATLLNTTHDVSAESELSNAINMHSAFLAGDWVTSVELGAIITVNLKGGVKLTTANSIDGPVWTIGHAMLPVKNYPDIDSLENFFCLKEHVPDVNVSGISPNYLNQLISVGYTDDLNFSVKSKLGRQFKFNYSPCWGSILVDETTEPHVSFEREDRNFSSLFYVETLQDANKLGELFKFEAWEALLNQFGARWDCDDRLLVLPRVTNSLDLTLSLSNNPDDRGFWLDPAWHSEAGYGSRKVKVNREPLRLGNVTFSEAVELANKHLTHPKTPKFKTLQWAIIRVLATPDRSWTLSEHDASLVWNGKFLTVEFCGLNNYPHAIQICSDESFDQELHDAWAKHSGELEQPVI